MNIQDCSRTARKTEKKDQEEKKRKWRTPFSREIYAERKNNIC